MWLKLTRGLAGALIIGVACASSALAQAKTEVATFGSGCFWCTESDFDKVPGVVATISGFAGGTTTNPTYEQVVGGRTGHTEVVQITFDPAKVSYEQLLEVYWRTTDIFDKGGQFCDRGSSYRPEIFTHSDAQKQAAEASKAALAKRIASEPALAKLKGKPIVVPVTPLPAFYPAEAYHQDFYQKNPGHYFRYRLGCGREYRLEEIWGSKVKS